MTTTMSEQNTHREAAVQQQQAAAQPRNLNAELQVLAKFGGFNVLESSVDGIQNLNPERKARRNIFLTDPERASERKELEKRLEMWVDMLQGNKSISEMIELCQKKSAAVSDLLSQNQLKAVEVFTSRTSPPRKTRDGGNRVSPSGSAATRGNGGARVCRRICRGSCGP